MSELLESFLRGLPHLQLPALSLSSVQQFPLPQPQMKWSLTQTWTLTRALSSFPHLPPLMSLASTTIAHFSQYFAACLLVIGQFAFGERDNADPATSSARARALATPNIFRMAISFQSVADTAFRFLTYRRGQTIPDNRL